MFGGIFDAVPLQEVAAVQREIPSLAWAKAK